MVTTVVIDDEDPSVTYLGKWVANYSSLDNKNTVHSTSDAGAQAIFKFKGSSVSVFGTLQRHAAWTPTVSFNIQGLTQGATTFTGKPSEEDNLTRQHFYTSPTLDPSEEHTLVITVVVVKGSAFWVDYFQVDQEDATINTPNASNTPSALPPQSTTLNNQSLSPTSTASLLSSSLMQTSSTISPNPSSTLAISDFHSPSSNLVLDATTATVTATQTQSLSTQNQEHSSNSKIIGAAVGGAVGGLVLIILALVFLLCFLRRRAKVKRDLLSSQQVTAFHSTASPTTPSTVSPWRGYESGAGYIVRGGLSKEKTVDRPENGNSGRVISESLPAYESDFDDTVPLRQVPG